MPDQLEFDLPEGRRRRDRGIARVSANAADWHGIALSLLRGMRREMRGRKVTGEHLRVLLFGAGLGKPPHYNNWGALTMAAAREGILVDTGDTAPSRRKKAHARKNPIWRFRG